MPFLRLFSFVSFPPVGFLPMIPFCGFFLPFLLVIPDYGSSLRFLSVVAVRGSFL